MIDFIKNNSKKIIIVFMIALLVFTLFIGSKIIINKRFVSKYPNTFNQEYRLLMLSIFNIYEPYVAYYNYGNYYYKEGRYKEAIEKYEKALSYDIPKNRICDVEINISLSLIQVARRSFTDDAINYLNEARKHLGSCINLDLEDIIKKEKEELAKQELLNQQKEEEKNENPGKTDDDPAGVKGQEGKDVKKEADDQEQQSSSGNRDGQTKSQETNADGNSTNGSASTGGKNNSPDGEDGGNKGEGNGPGDNGEKGSEAGKTDGGGGKNNENNGSTNSGEGPGNDGKGENNGGNSNTSGGANEAGNSNMSSGNSPGGATGSGSSENSSAGQGGGNSTGTTGTYHGGTVESKQKDAVTMDNELGKEINDLLKKLNDEKSEEEKLNDLDIDEELEKLRAANQEAMNLREISYQQIQKEKSNAAAKANPPKSPPSVTSGKPAEPDPPKRTFGNPTVVGGGNSGTSTPSTTSLNPGSTGTQSQPPPKSKTGLTDLQRNK